ncbi:beta-L-arabinofuranosidase domain-containing protein [Agromyces larvae]|uniref:Glycoside hydrolase family 127 protein n=1 Tax=Agromyces larvae TaxID=2929802 RepID=A0ABY4BYP6_9MICO|nr:beta-L-arabinofuranosidase domain-containing protein [Agromyces larvae]UOE44019.1 glycoside hydrolase family 127 protein [Agromyces larvae]
MNPTTSASPRTRAIRAISSVTVGLFLATAAATIAYAESALSVGPPVLDLGFEGDVTDSSEFAHPVQLKSPNGGVPSAAFVDGVVDGSSAIKLSGSTYLDLGSSETLLPQSLSLSFWLHPDTAMSGEEIITWNKTAYNSDGFYVSSESDTSPLAVSIGPSTGQPYKVAAQGLTRSQFFPVGQWTHVVITFDATSKAVLIYRNGVRVQTNVAYPVGETASGVIDAGAAVPKTIGYNGPNYNGAFLHTTLDEYALYAGAADVHDVAALYEAGGGTIDKEQIARDDAGDLNVPESTLVSLALQTTGSRGSDITWSSSDPSVIEADGTVHLPEEGADDVTVTLTATVRYAGGPATTRDFAVVVNAPTETLSDSGLEVLLSDDYLANGMAKEHEYLLSLSSDKFLYWFYRTAGLTPPTTSGYGGWENGSSNQNFRGHAFGHYISALSMSYAAATDPQTKQDLLAQIDAAVSGLEEVQASYDGTAQEGYLAPFRPSALDAVEGRGTSDDPVIVPYYNLHKVLAGLLDVVRYAPEALGERALTVAESWGEYLYGRMSTLQHKAQMRGTEYGGMNEALYELFDLTGNPHVKVAAEAFDDIRLFQRLAAGEDFLSGNHANTMIPKIIGALKRYTVFTQNPDHAAMLTATEQQELGMYLTAAQNFWRIVTEHHSYATGANSQSEHFHGPDTLYQYATQMGEVGNPQTAETCNVYNMLKLSRELFKLTRDVKYADFYETAYINDILSSQNPDTGMTTYFQAMAPGYTKLYSMPFTDFWCCTGSGMENFSKLGDSIYFTGSRSVWVNMFFSSSFSYGRANLKVTQSADMPNSDTVTFDIAAADGGSVASDAELRLRVPEWIGGAPTVTVNGSEIDPEIVEGYVMLTGLEAGDRVTYRMPMRVVAIATPDNPDFVAFKYGPMLLSAGVGTKNLSAYTPVGIGVRVPRLDPDALSTLVVARGTSADWIGAVETHLQRIEDSADGQVQFEVHGTSNADGTLFTPHYLRHDERYALYVTVESPDSPAAQQRILDAKLETRVSEMYIDSLTTFDNNNFEAEKNKKSSGNSTVGTFNGRQYRDASDTGWFSWDLEVDPEALPNHLAVTYYSGDNGRTFDLYVNDVKLKTERITNAAGAGRFYQQVDRIPDEHITGPNVRHKVDALGNEVRDEHGDPIPVVTVRFQATGGFAGGVFGIATSRPQEYDTTSTLKALTFTGGTLDHAFEPSRTEYVLTVPEGTEAVSFDADPVKASGLVKVGDILIDDTKPREVPLAGGEDTVLTIDSFAQDHTSKTSYTVTIREGEASAPTLEATVTTRCVAGKEVLVTTVRNVSDEPVIATVETSYGAKANMSIAAGAAASQSFTTRRASIPAGEVTVTPDAGEAVTVQYAAASCG